MILDTHCGFTSDAPENVRWSPREFVERVAPYEIYDPRPLHTILLVTALGLLVTAVVVFIWVEEDGNLSQRFGYINIMLAAGALATAGFTIIFLHGHLLKIRMIRKLSARPNRLFDPDWTSTLVGMEATATVDKLKWSSEDVGLLHYKDGLLLFEMINHRASFPIEALTMRVTETATEGGVALTYENEEQSWSVTLTPFSQSWNIFMPAFPSVQSCWLLNRIEGARFVTKQAS